jgi:glycosyltransferase involved in cell wall biosynthesis
VMKVMVVLPFAPWPVRVRASNLWPRVAKEVEVHVVALHAQLPKGQKPVSLANVASMELLEFSPRRALARVAMALPTAAPLRTSWVAGPRACRAVGAAYERIHPDVVYAERIRALPLLASIPPERIVLDPTDSLPMFYEQVRGQRGVPLAQRLLGTIECQRLVALERASFPSFARIVACSTKDADWMRKSAPAARVEVVANGVNLSTFRNEQPSNGHKRRVLLSGNFGYWPNREAASWLLRRAPEISEKLRSEVAFVGANPPSWLGGVNGSENIVVTGYVPDLATYYHSASVVAAPLRFAAGTQNKVIEAMACGRPVVATPESLAGLAAQGRSVAVEARREDFLEGLSHVLGSEGRSRRLGERGRAYVEAFHDWDRIASLMLRLLAEVAKESIATGRQTSEQTGKGQCARLPVGPLARSGRSA